MKTEVFTVSARTKEEILDLLECRQCGGKSPNTRGECICSYDLGAFSLPRRLVEKLITENEPE